MSNVGRFGHHSGIEVMFLLGLLPSTRNRVSQSGHYCPMTTLTASPRVIFGHRQAVIVV